MRNRDSARERDKPAYFMREGLNSDVYNDDGGINFDLLKTARKIQHDENRGELYNRMSMTFDRNSIWTGRLEVGKNYDNSISKELYKKY